MIEYKICSKCKKELPVSCFCRDKRKSSGYRSACKNCEKPIHDKYWKVHNEIKRLNYQYSENYCIKGEEDKIENYNLALKDNFHGWHRHHKLETHFSNGERRLVQITREELIALDMYYNRPSFELVWLTQAEHNKIHKSKSIK